MRYKAKEEDEDTVALRGALEPVLGGLGLSLVELNLFRRGKRGGGTVQVRLVLTRSALGTDDLAAAHRALLPSLELAFPGGGLQVELSSPGTDRLVREGAEFRHYTGRGIRVYRTDTSQWCGGVLRASDTEKILLETPAESEGGQGGIIEIPYSIIAKARLDDSFR
ncbi:MAG: ribosome assembly cofactor RimP [Treponema sp.]|jgi:ribosome maturation factor RimP|nr:ribosome assembly cofactor RimP [Treponema sp.]